jgi:hypothetical protein
VKRHDAARGVLMGCVIRPWSPTLPIDSKATPAPSGDEVPPLPARHADVTEASRQIAAPAAPPDDEEEAPPTRRLSGTGGAA